MSESTSTLHAVLDANLIVSGTITPSGTPGQILRAWRRQGFVLHTSADLIAEVGPVLSRQRIQARYGLLSSDIDQFVESLKDYVTPHMPLTELPIHCRDSRDDKVLACAFGSGAQYIVTGDDDLLSLEGEPSLGRLKIVTPRQFLDILGEQKQA